MGHENESSRQAAASSVAAWERAGRCHGPALAPGLGPTRRCVHGEFLPPVTVCLPV